MYAVVGKAVFKPYSISSVFFFLLAAAIRSAPMMKADRMKAATNTAMIIIPTSKTVESMDRR